MSQRREDFDPQYSWQLLTAGNERFAAGNPQHPHADAERLAQLRAGQSPHLVVLSCSDSRVPVELALDLGFGDAFVIRTAGHVLDDAVLASLEYAVEHLGPCLIAVMGHQSCGAVAAAAGFVNGGELAEGYQRAIVEQVAPAALAAQRAGKDSTDDFERQHTVATVERLLERMPALRARIDAGRLGIVGLRYQLDDARVETLVSHGVS